MSHTGSCVCGAVQFSIVTPITETGACHCGMCRKWSGGYTFTNGEARQQMTEAQVIEMFSEYAPDGT